MGNNESTPNAQPARRGIAIALATAVTTLALGVTAASWAGYGVRDVVAPVPEVKEPPQPPAPPPAPVRGRPPRDEGGTQVVLVPVERTPEWAAAEGDERDRDEDGRRHRHHEEHEGEDHDD